MSRTMLVMLVASATFGCERTVPPQNIPPATASTVATDAVTAPGDSARILFDIGKRELALEGYDSATVAYMKARPDHFFYNELHDFYAYNGWHFHELLRRYPDSALADDAAYELTNLMSQSGECEGWVPCYVHQQWVPIADFIGAYPTSPLVATGLERGFELFGNVLHPQRFRDPYEYELPEMREILADYDSATRILPPPLRARSDSALAQWRVWIEASDD